MNLVTWCRRFKGDRLLLNGTTYGWYTVLSNDSYGVLSLGAQAQQSDTETSEDTIDFHKDNDVDDNIGRKFATTKMGYK